ncbi:MAG: SPOR domain-containing protein [Proteobacteria bacterium]|nr:SPOR domain-containing protein [Pseudomonadota bacterium]
MRDLNEPLNVRPGSTAKFKQRLAGGAVLVLVLAIFLPFIFKHTHNAANQAMMANGNAVLADQASTPAPVPASTSATATAPVPANPSAPAAASMPQSTAPASSPTPQANLSSDQPGLTPQQSETATGPESLPPPVKTQPGVTANEHTAAHTQPHAQADSFLPPPAKTVAASKKLAVSSGQWLIQIGSFSQAKSAKGLAARLRAQGIPAYTVAGPHHMVRVYAGPLTNQRQAQMVQKRIRAEFKIDGFIIKNH